jgi:catechol 2,3-dioxygenase-like lactoylglutathione lyase family enzyme
MILDHIGLAVRDFARSRAFYLAALAPLGIRIVKEGDGLAGFNREGGKGGFWIGSGGEPTAPIHVAFAAKDHAEVRAFYTAAIAAGGRDNGAPGLRPQYHPDYYGAFVLDPDGHNIEAVCHAPETPRG